MAKRATAAAVAAAHTGPDYAAAVQIIEGRIAKAKSAQSEASGKVGAAWKDIEAMGIHRGGAQIAAKIMGMEDEDDRVDLLRTLKKMLEAAGIGIPQDLVDAAQGKEPEQVIPQRRVRTADEPAPDGPADNHDLAGEEPGESPQEASSEKPGEPEPPVARRRTGRVVDIGAAKQRAREHFGDAAN
jgi:hypothetical protein